MEDHGTHNEIFSDLFQGIEPENKIEPSRTKNLHFQARRGSWKDRQLQKIRDAPERNLVQKQGRHQRL